MRIFPLLEILREGVSRKTEFLSIWKIIINNSITEVQFSIIDRLNKIVGIITSWCPFKNNVESFLKKNGKFNMKNGVSKWEDKEF